jgi:4-hydroxy-3-methylbut-2-enyl diphosphate reductase
VSIRVEKLVLAGLRGFCAGVVRAVDVVEKALEAGIRPVYVRREIIHNAYVVDDLRARGARFVGEVDEVPRGASVIFSAHGVAPRVREASRARGLTTVDATCPLVAKVHLEALRYARDGYSILLIGHADHDETIGTRGEAPEAIRVIGTREEAEAVEVPDPARVAYLTQTTLSLDDTREIVDTLRRRFPALAGPVNQDICYATQNRQDAVKALARVVDAIVVLGSSNSSNSLRLCEVAQGQGLPAHLAGHASEIRPEWLDGVRVLGLTAGASTPEVLVAEAVAHARAAWGVTSVEELPGMEEGVTFSAPPELKAYLPPATARADGDR